MEEIIEKDMTPILLEDLGMRYPTENSKQKKRYGIYQCQYCSKEFETQAYNINTGHTKSCGCLNIMKTIERLKTHGLKKHPLYSIWLNMKARCYNKNHYRFSDYGGRGIKVCGEWLTDFQIFYDWNVSNGFSKNLTLDRIDVDGNYCLENCRWTTKEVQARNTRDIMVTNTSGFRGVSWNNIKGKWVSTIGLNNKQKHLGYFTTALEAAKAYETYVRINNLEHNFTPALTSEEIEALNEKKN